MNTYALTYWTGEARTVRAHSLINAAKQAGYTAAFQRDHSIIESGEMRVWSDYGDPLCVITELSL